MTEHEKLRERLERYSIPEPNSGCLLWTGAVDNCGYGRINIDGRNRRAHRVAFELSRGTMTRQRHVLHRCDNPACINVDHLRAGTHAENMADMAQKSRAHSQRGDLNGNAKLSLAEARRIKADPRTATAIARERGLSISAVSRIKRGASWGGML